MIRKLSVIIMASMIGVQTFAQTPKWKNFSCMYNVNSLTVTGGNLWAATSGGVFSYSPRGHTFNEFTTTEGLSNIQTTSIISDSGNILVGENDGTIDELDGSGARFRSQKDIEKSAALAKQVTNLVLVGDTLFACTPFGVVLVSEQSFVVLDNYLHFVPNQSTVQANSVAIFNGNIFVASQFGLSFASRSGVNLSAPDLWQVSDTLGFSTGVNALVVFNGALIAGTAQGIFYSTDGTTFQLLPGSAAMNVLAFVHQGNSLLVNSLSGLFKLNQDNSISPIYTGGTPLNSIASYSDTLIIAGTSRGLLAIGSSVQTILPPGPGTNIISNLSVDNSGNLWCSTSSNSDLNKVGVAFMKFDGTAWQNFSKEQNPILPTDSYFQISAVCGNQIVAGSWGVGMALLNEDGSVKKIFNSSNSSLVFDVGASKSVLVGEAACDPSGNIWMTNKSAYNGNVLAVFSPKDSSWHSFNNIFSPPSGFIPIAVDGFGGVWAGDLYGDASQSSNRWGVFYYNDNGTLTNTSDDYSLLITTDDGLLSNQINSIVVDNEDQVWIGTTAGLDAIYNPTDPQDILSIYSMLDQDILGIDYDALDDKWVSTITGVYELSKDGNGGFLNEYDITNSPLPDNQVNSVACDRVHGIVYFATNYGITQLKMGVVEPQTNFSKIKIFPNPVKFPLKQQVEIVGLVAESQIKIFSIAGKLVCDFQAQGGKIAYWNGTDDNGNILPSGIYIVVAYSSDGSQSAVTKVAIIR